MSGDERRRQLGDSDAPLEDEIVESFDRIDEGAERLARSWTNVLVTGTFGGLEVGLGVMAYLAVLHETGSHLLVGLAFGIGFIALLLAKSELYTEGFLVPITAVVAIEASIGQLMKLWSGTLVMNLVGGWLFMWLVVKTDLRCHPCGSGGDLRRLNRLVWLHLGLQHPRRAALGHSVAVAAQQGLDSRASSGRA